MHEWHTGHKWHTGQKWQTGLKKWYFSVFPLPSVLFCSPCRFPERRTVMVFITPSISISGPWRVLLEAAATALVAVVLARDGGAPSPQPAGVRRLSSISLRCHTKWPQQIAMCKPSERRRLCTWHAIHMLHACNMHSLQTTTRANESAQIARAKQVLRGRVPPSAVFGSVDNGLVDVSQFGLTCCLSLCFISTCRTKTKPGIGTAPRSMCPTTTSGSLTRTLRQSV